MPISRPHTTTSANFDVSGRGRPHQAVLANIHDEPERPTPCYYDPERWHPDEQQPDPAAMAACWSCFFQSRCALKALNTHAEFGIWAGYRLAPGPGLERSRKQLAIIAGLEVGPPAPPGGQPVSQTLTRSLRPHDGGPAAPSPTEPAETSGDEVGDALGDLIAPSARQPLVRQCTASPAQLALSHTHRAPTAPDNDTGRVASGSVIV